jgi:hypothetical protein
MIFMPASLIASQYDRKCASFQPDDYQRVGS